jgi:hypothetical protein
MIMNEGYVHNYFIAGACTPIVEGHPRPAPTLLAPGFNPGSSFRVEALLFTSLGPSKNAVELFPRFLSGPF